MTFLWCCWGVIKNCWAKKRKSSDCECFTKFNLCSLDTPELWMNINYHLMMMLRGAFAHSLERILSTRNHVCWRNCVIEDWRCLLTWANIVVSWENSFFRSSYILELLFPIKLTSYLVLLRLTSWKWKPFFVRSFKSLFQLKEGFGVIKDQTWCHVS